MEISLKKALETKAVAEKNEGRKVLLNLNDDAYQKVCKLLKDNGITFNAFINNFLVLLLNDKVKIEDEDIKEIIR